MAGYWNYGVRNRFRAFGTGLGHRGWKGPRFETVYRKVIGGGSDRRIIRGMDGKIKLSRRSFYYGRKVNEPVVRNSDEIAKFFQSL